MKAKTIEELIADYCAGALSAKEAARLHRYLRENPEAERMFRDAREVHSVLRSAKVAGGMDVREAERRFRALLARRSRRARAIRWLGGGMAAAAVIVAVPGATGVMFPSASTVATFSSELDHVSAFSVVLSGVKTTLSLTASFMASSIALISNAMLSALTTT